MTLNNVLNLVQYGKGYMEEKALENKITSFKDKVAECYDEEIDTFYASRFAKCFTEGIVMTEGEEAKTNRLLSKLSAMEKRIEAGNTMSDAYRKIQCASIVEDCKSLQEEVAKARRTDLNKIEHFGNILGTAKAFVESFVDKNAVIKESSNALLNKAINEAKDRVEEVLEK